MVQILLQDDAGGFGVWASGGNLDNGTDAIFATSADSNAVHGESQKGVASGVYGHNSSNGYGVAGRATNGTGVLPARYSLTNGSITFCSNCRSRLTT